jgi:ethanolamine utilization microcompartment shell protein EutL
VAAGCGKGENDEAGDVSDVCGGIEAAQGRAGMDVRMEELDPIRRKSSPQKFVPDPIEVVRQPVARARRSVEDAARHHELHEE